jgi:hypothetical protein
MTDLLARALVNDTVSVPNQMSKKDKPETSNSALGAATSGTITVIINGTTYAIPSNDQDVFNPHSPSSAGFLEGTTHFPGFAHYSPTEKQNWVCHNKEIDVRRSANRS